jgi:alkanesulfonate monooxygenase SsuD/methylene tetrahydromethanopterin reductase-like flavin-dependent oxidoreductase (luciferase family)
MRFGLALPQYGFSMDDGSVGFDVAATWARRAEKLGFDSVWLSDHFFYSFGRYGADPAPIAALEPMTALAGLAAVTERVRLGSLVLCAPFRRPAVLARMAATVDAISGGRFDLGLGAGWLKDEFDAFGFEFESTGRRFEVLEQTLAALSDRGGVRLCVGGKGGPRMLRLAASLADGWNTVWRVEPVAHGERIRAAGQACEKQGRDPSSLRASVGLYSIVGETEAQARASFERWRSGFPGGAMSADTWESWRADTLSGSPEQAIERVEQMAELGVEEIIVSPGVLPFSILEPDMLDLLARSVISRTRQSS